MATAAGENKLDREVTKLQGKLDSATANEEKLKGKLKETSTAAKKPAPNQNATKPSFEEKLALERERMEMRHEFKVKDALREENLASKCDERRAKQKDARGRIGMGLVLGSGGMFNTNPRGLFATMVSSLV